MHCSLSSKKRIKISVIYTYILLIMHWNFIYFCDCLSVLSCVPKLIQTICRVFAWGVAIFREQSTQTLSLTLKHYSTRSIYMNVYFPDSIGTSIWHIFCMRSNFYKVNIYKEYYNWTALWLNMSFFIKGSHDTTQ